MGYIDKNLMKGEKIVYQSRLHWAVFIWPVIFLIVGVLFVAAGNVSVVVGILFIIAAMLIGLSSLINYYTSEFGVTSKRVLVKVGFIRRHSFELLLAKVEGIGVVQGVLGRILGYGTIIVTGTGGSKEPFSMIDTPFEFRKHVQEQIAAIQESK